MAEPDKKCCHCKETKLLGCFSKDRRNKDGLNGRCKICDREAKRFHYHTIKNPGYIRRRHYKSRFSLTVEEFDEMLEQQDGVCVICKKLETMKNKHGVIRHLCIDHDHETGKVRGLLCDSCNRGIGCFGDNIEYFLNAIKYLRNN